MVSAELILSLGKGAGELPSQGPFQTFFSTALKKKSMTLTLFGLIQSVEMTWYLFPALPIAQLHAHTHLSCTLAPLVSFPWTLPSFTVHARPFSVLLVQPPSLGGCRQTVLSKPSFAGGSSDPVCKLQHHP